MKKILFPLLLSGALFIHGDSVALWQYRPGSQKPILPEANKVVVDPAKINATRRRSPKKHLRRFISGITRKRQQK